MLRNNNPIDNAYEKGELVALFNKKKLVCYMLVLDFHSYEDKSSFNLSKIDNLSVLIYRNSHFNLNNNFSIENISLFRTKKHVKNNDIKIRKIFLHDVIGTSLYIK